MPGPGADFEPGAGRRIAVTWLRQQLGGALLPLGVVQLAFDDAAVLVQHVAAVLLPVVAGLVGAERFRDPELGEWLRRSTEMGLVLSDFLVAHVAAEERCVVRFDQRRNHAAEREPEILPLGGGPTAAMGGRVDGSQLVQLVLVAEAGGYLGSKDRVGN